MATGIVYSKTETDVLLAAAAPLDSPALIGAPTVNGHQIQVSGFIDGGDPSSIYLTSQIIDGGTP